MPIYEIVSGAALAFAAILLILPGFATDTLGLLIIFPPTRRLFIKRISKNYPKNNNKKHASIKSRICRLKLFNLIKLWLIKVKNVNKPKNMQVREVAITHLLFLMVLIIYRIIVNI